MGEREAGGKGATEGVMVSKETGEDEKEANSPAE